MEISRRLQISPSTIHHWARADGFRRKDIKARASLSAGPVMPGKADYPELKEMAPRARLARLHELSGMARLRAIAAVEEGYVEYGLKWLREAQKLGRAWRALREYLENYPPPEEEVNDTLMSRALEMLAEMVQADEEGREPVFRELPPHLQRESEENARIWDAIEDARLARMTRERDGRAPDEEELGDDRLHNLEEDVKEYWRLKGEVKKWRLLPGRGDPPFLRAVSRGRSVAEHPSLVGRGAGGEGVARDQKSHGDFPSDERMTLSAPPSQPSPPTPLPQAGEGAKSGGPRLYGIEDAFPVRVSRRE
ncbi:hypothetical protein ACQKH5_11570 [Hyphomonas sp. NPDC076900]|uniref:hypothetical protein n=1 Tax=unclassified Hyphomonas TaxID=2630699 RepID=UPI003D003728